MGDPMRIRAQLKDGVTDVRVLMAHPMETGLRKDSSGKIIPAHFINDVKATSGGKPVLAARWGQAIAQNPYLQFRFKGAKAGDTVVITWTDNTGDSRTDEVPIS
jgi:sulfur-oxidizing protein SoxZ